MPPPPPEDVMGLDPLALLRAGRGKAQQVGDYELLERIADGGMGVVWRARQISLDRTVALKMIRSGLLASDEEVQRFRREAESAAALDHPHIVPIYEVGEDDGRHFFSMKLIDGGNLAELSARCDGTQRQGSEWVRRAATIIATLARALHHAHQRGLLHRDVKPTNVLLDEEGQPHLTDFGLAKLAEGAAEMTMSLAVLGTPTYMAPEQAAGNNRQLTIAADIYSLGAVLYELLSGRPPFEGGSTLELLRQVQECEANPVRKSNPGLHRDLDTICLKCLQKDPRRRYATAEELAADLDRWLARQPIHARPVRWMERLWLWSRRNPAAAMAGALLLALTIVATAAAVRLHGQRDEINALLGRSLLAQAYAQRLGTAPERRAQNLALVAEAARISPSLKARNEAVATLALPALSRRQTWYQAQRQFHTHQRMLSADGERYAIFGQLAGITVHNRRDGSILAVLDTPPGPRFAGELSPDGRWLVSFDQAGAAWVWDLGEARGGALKHSLFVPGPWGEHPGFTPDGRSLVLAGNDNHVRLFDLASGAERLDIQVPYNANRVAVSPSGNQLAFDSGGTLFVWVLGPAGEVRNHKHESNITRIAWHPSGRFLAIGYESGEMQLFDSQSGASRWLTPHSQNVIGLAFDASGEILASSSWDSVRRCCDTATGRVLFEMGESGGVQGTTDGRWFATFEDDGSISAREILGSRVLRTFASAKTGYPGLSGVDISPDGRWLASGDSAGLHLWEIATGDEVVFQPSATAWRPRFHPGGRFIVTAGKESTLRWAFDAAGESGARLGPPELVEGPHGKGSSEVDFTPDGEWMMVPRRNRSSVQKWSNSEPPVLLGNGKTDTWHDYAVLSPDAKWAAGATYGGIGVTIWDAHTGALLQHLIQNENARLAVSPDGTTLATATAEELVLWDTTTWRPRTRRKSGITGTVPVPVAFSPDGTLLAAALTRQEILLLDARTNETLAALTPPVPLNLVTLRFSSDGRRLAAQTLGPVIHLWDLQALRRDLRSLGLDWEN